MTNNRLVRRPLRACSTPTASAFAADSVQAQHPCGKNRRSSCAKHAAHPAEIYNGRKSERVAHGEVEGEVAAKVGVDDGEMVALALVDGVDGLHAAVEAEDEEA